LDILSSSSALLVSSIRPYRSRSQRGAGQPDSLAYFLGLWKKYSKFPALSRDAAVSPGQVFLDSNIPLWNLINSYFAQYFPELYARHRAIPKPSGFQLGCYAMAVLNIGVIPDPHFDQCDCHQGMTAVAPFGSYSGGFLRLDDLNLDLTAMPGDLIFFNSYFLKHSVTTTTGSRNSICLLSHETLFDFYGV
jgi:hypothetical protein